MKKYLVHTIYLVIIAFLVVYAIIKANEAEKQTALAIMSAQEAKAQAEMAARQAELAEMSAAEAKIAENRAAQLAEELKECKTQKK